MRRRRLLCDRRSRFQYVPADVYGPRWPCLFGFVMLRFNKRISNIWKLRWLPWRSLLRVGYTAATTSPTTAASVSFMYAGQWRLRDSRLRGVVVSSDDV